ncbi:MAG: protein kinase [Labilithrix sp.]|nr:protein kinase [Labilithrix sp.]
MSCPSETRLQAFVDGELDPDEIATLSVHLDGCAECRIVVGVVQPVPLDDETTTERIGRYVLRRVLGKGGMGVVYEAVDPDLHRVVALKVLRTDLGARQKRLLGEAEAMAKLAHPNVVSIYDVGRSDERVFIVMALVEGPSLRHWLASEERSLDATLDAFLQAADGLRAAHDAGLVHRDFKPENVFVAKGGRVLVGDFGLAAQGGDAVAGEGSLAYMAPEQRSGDKIDARADQWSFCVSLREATDGRAPRWLAKVIARGTKTDPADRFASMSELVAAIASGRRRARLRTPIAIAAGVSMLATGALLHPRDSRDLPLCKSGDARIAAVWNDDASRRIEAAFRATKSSLAEGAWRKASPALAAYAGGWRGALRRTCEAPPAKDEAAARVVDRKMSCLSDRVETLRAVASSLERADAPMLEQVPAMLALLPPVGACDDVRELAAQPAPPSIEKRAPVDAAKRKLADASASLAAGRYDEGLARANEAFEGASAAGYLPVLAEAYLGVGTAHGRLGHAKESEQALEHAVSSASAGHAPAIAVRAWIQLMHFVGFEGKRYEDGHRYAEYAKASLESMPGADDLAIERLAWLRAMLLDQKRFTEALVVSREELALVDRRFGSEHHRAAVANDGLAGVLAGQCKPRDAIAPQEKCCAIFEREYGAPHPQVALCLGNLAALWANLGEHDRAIAIKARALSMFQEVTGHPNHVAMAHRNMARSLLELDRLADAKREIDAASALSKRDSDELSVLLLAGDLQRREGRLKESSASLEQAVLRTKAAPPSRRVEPLASLAETRLRLERFAEAASLADEAATAARTAYGAGSCRTAEPLRVRADALLAMHRPAEAMPVAEAALAALQDAQIDPRARERVERAVTAARSDR